MISDLDYFDCVESLFYKTWLTEWLSDWPNPTSRDPSDLKNSYPDITESAEGTDEQNEIGSLSHAA